MATVRAGEQTVLLVVDLQVGVLHQAWDAARVVQTVSAVVDRARSRGLPVVWVQHADDELPAGSPAWAWAPPLAPAAGETVVHKGHNSSFEATCLDEVLAGLRATHIVLAGAATNWCIRATAYGALERGYDLTLVADGHTTQTLELGDGVRVEALDVIRDLNATMAWLSYPGRRNAVAAAAQVLPSHGD